MISKNIKKYDGIIALGCVIKGETPHFEFISTATTDAIMEFQLNKKTYRQWYYNMFKYETG